MKPPVLYKTLSYTTFERGTYTDIAHVLANKSYQEIQSLLPKIEDNRNRPSEIDAELSELGMEGWEVLWAFNTEYRIELLLYKVVGELTPREIQEEKMRELTRLHPKDEGFRFGSLY